MVSSEPVSKEVIYTWHQISLFNRWYGSGRGFILCLNCPQPLQEHLERRLPTTSQSDPYDCHLIFLEEIMELYDSSVWGLRDLVRGAEKTRGAAQESFRPDFLNLHEIARHMTHSNETLEVAVDTADTIIREHKTFHPEHAVIADGGSSTFQRVQRQLHYMFKELRAIKARSTSLTERLQNEINLAFNIVSQRNSQMIVRMNENATSDNAMMKTVAVAGLLYLPGTFVSGLFGMNFFNFNPNDAQGDQEWVVSDKFWIYWAITAPLTMATVIIWAAWHNWKPLRWQFSWLQSIQPKKNFEDVKEVKV